MPVSMTVNWPASKHVNDILYQLQYRPLGGSVWINARSVPVASTSQIITGLQPGTTYEFRHIASNPGWTEVSVATPLRAGVPPAAPTGLKVSN